jgi:GTP cyclohydrolase II
MVRGAYAGTLFPGRTSSMSQATTRDTGMSYPEKCGPHMVKIHSECYTSKTVRSTGCDCGEQLDEAARLMSLPIPAPSWTQGEETGKVLHQNNCCAPPAGGVIIYLRQKGRGIGLSEKLEADSLQDLGNNIVEANLILRHPGDACSYGLATAMLIDLGLDGERGIKLLTNNPDKIRAVEGSHKNVRVVRRIPMIPLA